eukprot:scaffold30926_cov84-Isochrysis_galbana.AAC.1
MHEGGVNEPGHKSSRRRPGSEGRQQLGCCCDSQPCQSLSHKEPDPSHAQICRRRHQTHRARAAADRPLVPRPL